MSLIDEKTNSELIESLLEEVAKAQNELNCGKADITKAQSRIRFVLMLLHKLTDRQENNNEISKTRPHT